MADIKASLILDTKQTEKGLKKVGNAMKAVLGAAAVKEVLDVANAFQEVRNKLMSVSESSAEATSKFNDVVAIARETRSGLTDTADLYFRMTKASENLGLSQKETAKVTELFAKTLKNSGATSTEAASAILQFGQAMASGRLSGDEFRSINESNTDMMDRLAKSLDVTRGALKGMATEGKLTAEVVTAALLESAEGIDATYAKTIGTLAESFTAIKREFTILVGKIESSTGIFAGLATSMVMLSENLGKVAVVMSIAFGVKVAQGIMGVVKSMQALKVATKAQNVAQAVMLSLMGPAGWAILAGGVVAAGTAIYALNKLTDDSAESQAEVGEETENTKKTAKELLALAEEKVVTDKTAKKLTEEQTRLLADQISDYQAMGDAIKLNGDAFRTNLEVQDQISSATQDQAEVIRGVADIEEDRKDALIELAQLTEIDATKRLAREKEINDEYDQRIILTKQQIAVQQAGQNALTYYNNVLDLIGRSAIEEQRSFKEQQGFLKQKTVAERELYTFSLNLRKSITDAELDLQLKTQAAIFAEQEKFAAKKQQFTEKDKQAVIDRFATEQTELNKSAQMWEQYSSMLLGQFLLLRESTRTFKYGITEALMEFRDQVENSAAYGTDLFNTMTQGWEDAFVKFAETGKLSFKDLFKSLMVEIIKMQANKLFLALFGGAGSVFGSLFAGLFHNGGNIPAGKFGIAGERGPEIITGPASVMSTNDTSSLMGNRGTSVNYTINAVDSQSFEMALARDPSFVFAVTEAGRRKLPGRA